jgi:RAD51-like protein 3
MRLSLFAFLPEDFVSSLEQIGIRTESDLLFSAPTADILRKLPSETVTLQELKNYTTQVVDECSVLGVCGDALLAVEREKQERVLDFGSGVRNLDALLNGFGGSRVFEISGEKATGKTARSIYSQ